MITGSLQIGRLFGIPVRAHWTILLIAALFGTNLAALLGVVAGVIAMVAFFLTILAHEFGHALVARRYGIETESIDLWALGGVARLDREAPTPGAEAWVALAGPIVSLLIGITAFSAGLVLGVGLIAWVGFVNLFLAAFNMLPGAPLDGGRVLRAFRWWRTGDRYRSMRDAGNAGRVLGWLMAGAGIAMMFNGGPGIFIAITGVFIALNARAEVGAAAIGAQLDGLTVGDLTWFGVAHAGTDMDADSMIWQRQRLGSAGAVAIVDADGELDGLVLEDQLWAIPSERRAMVMLTQLMVPFEKLAKASPDEELAMVLPRLNPLRPVVTVWKGDQLLGVVPPRRLRERLAAAGATASG
ncbi:MAG: site-2 protease family protein [Acidimicrobiia bacterium]|nr:site-2 protease family protein [Acidimicrobiia bacterium]